MLGVMLAGKLYGKEPVMVIPAKTPWNTTRWFWSKSLSLTCAAPGKVACRDGGGVYTPAGPGVESGCFATWLENNLISVEHTYCSMLCFFYLNVIPAVLT